MEAHRLPFQGRTVAIQVLARREVRHLAPDVPYLVVSIANSDAPHPVLPDSLFCRGVLRLAFDDVAGRRGAGKTPMTPAQAHEVREFVETRLGEFQLIVVHCDAGMCRSPAVAAALWRWLEGTRGPFFEAFRPNEHVYRTTREALSR